MRIAFAIMKLFAGGGLQRDCVEIARLCRQRGHDVVIFTSFTDDSGFADDLPVAVLPVQPGANHRMQEQFGTQFRFATAVRQCDLRVGFDRLPGLDVLYCADPSIGVRMQRQPWRFLIPRYRAYRALEGASFAPGRRTRVLLLSDGQRNGYRAAWATPQERLTLLPPTVCAARRRPEYRRNGVREAMRADLGVTADETVWLAVGVQPHTKGFDRTLRALRAFPQARLVIAGLGDKGTRAAASLAGRVRRAGLSSRVSFLGHREDIPHLMAAGDLLVHPARHDTTGTVILEAVVNGLPVVTTAVCGYARHVADAGAGLVIPEPFRLRALIAALETAEDAALRDQWSEAGQQYGAHQSLYDGRTRAAEIIMAAAAERGRAPAARRVVGLVARMESPASGSVR